MTTKPQFDKTRGASVRSAICVAAFLGLSFPAAAEGIYGKLHGGVTAPPNLDVTLTMDSPSPGTVVSSSLDTDLGFIVGGAVGYEFDAPVRIEAEFSYRSISADPAPAPGGAGDIGGPDAWTVMANAYYNFDLGGRLSPYIGGGAGIARTSDLLGGESDTSIAIQGIAGIEYELTKRQRVGIEYRYFYADDFSTSLIGPGGGGVLKTELRSNDILLTWRFTL